jgi:hypothetical protein
MLGLMGPHKHDHSLWSICLTSDHIPLRSGHELSGWQSVQNGSVSNTERVCNTAGWESCYENGIIYEYTLYTSMYAGTDAPVMGYLP